MESEHEEQGFLPLVAMEFGDDLTDAVWTGRELRATLAVSRLIEFLTFVRNDERIALRYPAILTAIDDGEKITLVYRLTNLGSGASLLLHVPIPRENPVVPSATVLWKGFDWHEREVYDMFGVRFEGHPNLKRILLPDEWEGFPFRKDYVSTPSGNPVEGPQPVDPVGGTQ
jgi:NADH-quinone oxidoreductase subunit C